MKLCVFVLLIILHGAFGAKNAVEEAYYWRKVNYEKLPLDDDAYIGNYKYHIPENNDVIGMSFHALSGLMLATVSRLREGVPSTLNAFCVSDYPFGTSPYLWGFPNYEKNTLKASFYDEPNDGSRKPIKRNINDTRLQAYHDYFFGDYRHDLVNGRYKKPVKRPFNFLEDFTIISVHHPQVDDRCNRVFAVDTGYLQYNLGANVYEVQLPALLVFELPANGCEKRQFPVLRRVEIPQYLWQNQVGFNFITLDFKKKCTCDDLVVYIAHAFDSSLIAYDYKRGDFWKVEHSSMKPVMSESFMVFNKDYNYQLPLGVVSLALGWPDKEGNSVAYYMPGASQAQYAVSTKYLKYQKSYSYKQNFGDYVTLLGYRGCNSQAYKQVFDDSTGIMYYAEMQSNRVRCWNTQLPLNPDNLGVVMESDALQFVSALFIDSEGYLWFHSSHVPIDFLTDTPLDITDVNSKTFRVKTSEAVKGTVCEL